MKPNNMINLLKNKFKGGYGMSQEEIKEALIDAANNGCIEEFKQMSKQLDQTLDNRIMIHFYSKILGSHPKIRHNISSDF